MCKANWYSQDASGVPKKLPTRVKDKVEKPKNDGDEK